MKRKQALVIQPGAFGDIIECAPIAKYYYDNGYDITWPSREEYSPLFRYFEYINHETIPEVQIHSDWLKSDVDKILKLYSLKKYDIVLNLADRGPHATDQRANEKSASARSKYRMANLPFSLKYKLDWKRVEYREKELYNKIVGDLGDYIFCHVKSSKGHVAPMPEIKNRSVVTMDIVEDYQIPDWFLIIKEAKEIYCTESSVHCFIDNVCQEHFPNTPKFLLRREGLPPGVSYTESPTWDKRWLSL